MALLEAARRFSQTASSLGKGTGRGGEAGTILCQKDSLARKAHETSSPGDDDSVLKCFASP